MLVINFNDKDVVLLPNQDLKDLTQDQSVDTYPEEQLLKTELLENFSLGQVI